MDWVMAHQGTNEQISTSFMVLCFMKYTGLMNSVGVLHWLLQQRLRVSELSSVCITPVNSQPCCWVSLLRTRAETEFDVFTADRNAASVQIQFCEYSQAASSVIIDRRLVRHRCRVAQPLQVRTPTSRLAQCIRARPKKMREPQPICLSHARRILARPCVTRVCVDSATPQT